MPQIASIESEPSVTSNDPPKGRFRRQLLQLYAPTGSSTQPDHQQPRRHLGYSEGGDLVLTGLLIKTSPSRRDSRTAGSWLSCIHAAAYCQQLLAVPPPGSPLGAPARPIEGPGGGLPSALSACELLRYCLRTCRGVRTQSLVPGRISGPA